MGDIITSIMESFSGVISGFTSGIRDAFTGLFYETNAAGEEVMSGLAKFGFVMLGFGAAVGIVYFILRLIRR